MLIPDPNDAADLAARLRTWRGETGRFAAAVSALGAQLRAHTWDRMAEEFVGLMGGARDGGKEVAKALP
jgi:hypothetical protein